MRRVLFLLSLVCAAPTALPAQQLVLPLQVGDRVKLAARLGDPMATANVLALRDDALSIAYVGDESTVIERPFVSIETMRVSQGASRLASAKWAAGFGAFLVGGAGAVAGPLAAHSLGWGIGQSIMTFAVGGALTGGSLGGAVGAILPRERWKTYVFQREEIAARMQPE